MIRTVRNLTIGLFVLVCCTAYAGVKHEFGMYLLDLGLNQRARVYFEEALKDKSLEHLDIAWCRHGLGLVAKADAMLALAEVEQLGGGAEAVNRADALFVESEKAFISASDAYLEMQNELLLKGEGAGKISPRIEALFNQVYHESRLQAAEVYLFHAQIPGLNAAKRGDALESSEQLFSYYLELEPPLPRAILGMGLVLFEKGEYARAVRDFERALAKPEYAAAESQQQIIAYKVRALVELGRFDKGLEAIEQVPTNGPKSAQIELLRARALFGTGKRKQAYEIATLVARSQGPSGLKAANLLKEWADQLDTSETASGELVLANDKYDRGKYEEALEMYQKVASSTTAPELAGEATHKSGLCYIQLKQTGQAIAAFRKAAVDYSQSSFGPQAAYLLVHSSLHELREQRTDAVRDEFLDTVTRVLELYPRHESLGEFHYLRGSILMLSGRLESAVEDFEEVPEASERYVAALLASGKARALLFERQAKAAKIVTLELKQAFDMAIEALNAALDRIEKMSGPENAAERDNWDAEARIALARLHSDENLGDRQKVIDSLSGMPAGLPPSDPMMLEASLLQLKAFVDLGRAGDARRQVVNLVKGKPERESLDKTLIVLYNALVAESRKSKPPEEQVKELAGAMVELLKADGWKAQQLYLAGASLAAVHENDRAINVLDTLIEKYGADPDAAGYVSRGRADRADCLREMKQWNDALAVYLDLLRVEGEENSPRLLSGAARCLTELGRYDEAVERWRMVVGSYRKQTPEWFEARLDVVETLLRAKKNVEAKEELELIKNLYGDPPTAELKARAVELLERAGKPGR